MKVAKNLQLALRRLVAARTRAALLAGPSTGPLLPIVPSSQDFKTPALVLRSPPSKTTRLPGNCSGPSTPAGLLTASRFRVLYSTHSIGHTP